MPLPDSYFNPDGSMKPFSQRMAERDAADRAAANVARQVAERTAKPESRDEQVQRVTAERIAEIQDRLRGSLLPADRSRLTAELTVLKAGNAKIKDRIEEQQRIDRLAKDRRVQLARDSADALEKSWRHIYPHADEADVMLAVAIARSNEFDSPDDLYREFKAVEERIAEADLEAERRKADDAQHAALKAESESAAAQVRVAEGQVRLAKVQGAVDATQ